MPLATVYARHESKLRFFSIGKVFNSESAEPRKNLSIFKTCTEKELWHTNLQI